MAQAQAAVPDSFPDTQMWPLVAALLVMALLWLGAIDHRDLFDPDEGRYAEIAREMLVSNDWVTPRLNGIKYFEKPPLQYWITALAFKLFGVSAGAARVWPALCGLMTIGLAGFSARRLSDARGGSIASFALASTFLFFALGQIVTLDLGVTFFLTLVLSAFLAVNDSRLTDTRRGNYALVMWGAMALAVLSKGLIGVVLPGLVLTLYMLIERDVRLIGRLRWWPGLALFGLIVLPWFALVQIRNPEFLGFFVIHEHLNRYLESGHQRNGAWYFYPAVLALGSLPWTIGYGRSLIDALRSSATPDLAINGTRLLVIWVLAITVFFMLSQSKLPAYVLPVLPALAMLLGWAARRVEPRRGEPPWRLLAAAGAACVALTPFIDRLPVLRTIPDAGAPFVRWLAGAGVLLMVTALASRWLLRSAPMRLFICTLGTLAAMQAIQFGTQTVAPAFSTSRLVVDASEKAGGFDRSAAFYSVRMYDQTLPWHLQRLVTVVDYRDELDFGLRQEPWLTIASLDEFRQRWNQSPQAYALLPADVLQTQQHEGLLFVQLAGNGREVLVARRAVDPPD